MEAAAKRFFSSPYFAVVGASQDKSKFGYRSEYISVPQAGKEWILNPKIV